MTTNETNALRARIAELDGAGLTPREIAKRASCALSTVYKLLSAPGPDRRVFRDGPHNRTDATTAAAVRALAAANPRRSARAIRAMLAEERASAGAEPAADAVAGAGGPGARVEASVDPLPAERTIRRLMRAGPAEGAREGEPAALALYAWPDWDDYAAASAVAAGSLSGEIAVLRAIVRHGTRRLAEEPLEAEGRQRLESHTRATILALTALVRSRRSGSGNPAALDELLRMGIEWGGRVEG